jgi:hypothetical protein
VQQAQLLIDLAVKLIDLLADASNLLLHSFAALSRELLIDTETIVDSDAAWFLMPVLLVAPGTIAAATVILDDIGDAARHLSTKFVSTHKSMLVGVESIHHNGNVTKAEHQIRLEGVEHALEVASAQLPILVEVAVFEQVNGDLASPLQCTRESRHYIIPP